MYRHHLPYKLLANCYLNIYFLKIIISFTITSVNYHINMITWHIDTSVNQTKTIWYIVVSLLQKKRYIVDGPPNGRLTKSQLIYILYIRNACIYISQRSRNKNTLFLLITLSKLPHPNWIMHIIYLWFAS